MIQHFRGPLLEFPLSFTSRTVSTLMAEMIKPHRIFQSGFDCNAKFFLCPCKIINTPNQQDIAWKIMPTFSKKYIMDIYLCLENWLQYAMDNGLDKKLNRGY